MGRLKVLHTFRRCKEANKADVRGTFFLDPRDGGRRGMSGCQHRIKSDHQALVDQVKERAEDVDEPVWQLPLATKRYRKLLDSVVADMRNIGGRDAGTITAAIFLSEFIGDVPWAHLDIAGPMNADGDSGINSKGATGFGTRLLIDLACNFEKPAS